MESGGRWPLGAWRRVGVGKGCGMRDPYAGVRGVAKVPASRRALSLPVGAVLVALMCASGAPGAERAWTLGTGEHLWSDWTQSSSAVEFLDGGRQIKLVSFAQSQNIVAQLDWTATGTPQDYVTDLAYGRAWDNNPLRDPAASLAMVDGDSATATGKRFKQAGVSYANTSLFFDLGTRYPVNRLAFFPRQVGADDEGRLYRDDFIRAYDIMIQDGESFSDGNLPVYENLRTVAFTTSSVADILFPLQFVRYIRLRITSTTPFEVAEFQVFGQGFSPRAGLTSKVVDLREEANFSQLTWTVQGLRQEEAGQLQVAADAAARFSVMMRTGSTPSPQLYYRIANQTTGERIQVTEAEYNKLEAHQQGGIEEDQTQWSPWSAAWTQPGVRIDRPSPRRYFQLRAQMESGAIRDGLNVSDLAVRYATPPLALELLGEITLAGEPSPPGGMPVAPAGEYSTFVYDVKADVRRTDVGFNALEIWTPARPRFEGFERGGPSWLALAPAQVDSVAATDSSLVVYFQPVTSPEYLRVHFSAQLFAQATSFDGQARHTQRSEPPQRLMSGDAHPGVHTLPSNSLRVLTSAASARTLLAHLEIAPAVVTPNGDGINDRAQVSYILTQLLEPVPVTLGIFDLSGRRVRGLEGQRGSGAHAWVWDGRDDEGRLLPVGTYIVRLVVEADSRHAEYCGVIGLAY
jgi:hypothetical protein